MEFISRYCCKIIKKSKINMKCYLDETRLYKRSQTKKIVSSISFLAYSFLENVTDYRVFMLTISNEHFVIF